MKRILTAAIALSLLSGTVAMAQPDRHDDHGGYNQGRDDRRDNRDNYGHDRNDRRASNYGHDNGRHEGHRWARGQRLPATYYRDRSHYVDYRVYHLRAPPRGYRWVRTDDNNYAMVAITTGLIAAIIASSQ